MAFNKNKLWDIISKSVSCSKYPQTFSSPETCQFQDNSLVLVRTGLLWAASYLIMLVQIEQKYLENLTHHIRGHSIIKFALRREGFQLKCEQMKTGGR